MISIYRIIVTLVILISIQTITFAKKRITIVYTNSLNGYLDDCRCKEHPKGGLVARGTELKKIRKNYKNVFVFETGDFFPVDSDKILEKYLVKGYKYLAYDGVAFGDQELSGGVAKFLEYKDVLPFVNNNVRFKIDGKWKSQFDRFRIVEKSGIKAGVIGTIAPATFKYYKKDVTDNVVIWDQAAELNKDIKIIKGKRVDIIILLSHSGLDHDKKLAARVKGIDVIVGGHSQSLTKRPVKAGKTIIVQAGTNGARIGIIELSIGKRIKIIKNRFTLPHLKVTPADKEIQKMIEKYKKEAKESMGSVRFN